jgi:transposase-like protein
MSMDLEVSNGRTRAIVVRDMLVCPYCGGVDTLRVNGTKRDPDGKIQYGRCKQCGAPVLIRWQIPARVMH